MAKANLETRRKAREYAKRIVATKKLGTGERFAAVAASAKAGGARNPEAVAAMMGRRKHGAKKMAQMAAAGRKK